MGKYHDMGEGTIMLHCSLTWFNTKRKFDLSKITIVIVRAKIQPGLQVCIWTPT